MSRTVDLTLTVTFDSEEGYERFVDDVMALSEPYSGALSGIAWDGLPEDGDVRTA